VSALLGAGLGVASVVAVAQDSGPTATTSGTAATGGTVEEVVVTGSRVGRTTFTTPNPVTVLDSKDIQNLGLTNVGGVLGELPQTSNFFAANNVGLGNFNVGAQLANLRGLNPFFGTRTLIPSMLVSRTEVVTGGASAIYGSEPLLCRPEVILRPHYFRNARRLRYHHDHQQHRGQPGSL
jgi:outer membrane receptor protein involved in Fe transport